MSIDILHSYYAEDRIVGVRIQHCVRGHDGHWLGVVVGEEALIDRLLSYFDPMFRSRVTRAFEHPKVRGVTVTNNFELPITRSHGAYPGARAFCRGEDPELN